MNIYIYLYIHMYIYISIIFQCKATVYPCIIIEYSVYVHYIQHINPINPHDSNNAIMFRCDLQPEAQAMLRQVRSTTPEINMDAVAELSEAKIVGGGK